MVNGNMLPPRVVVLPANTATKLNTTHKRAQMLVFNNTGANVGVTPNSAETSIANTYQFQDQSEYNDLSSGNVYGVSTAGGSVIVVEVEA